MLHELSMFWTALLSIIKSFNTVYTAIGIYHASYIDCLLARSGPDLPSRQLTELAWQIPIAVYRVLKLLMMDGRSVRNM